LFSEEEWKLVVLQKPSNGGGGEVLSLGWKKKHRNLRRIDMAKEKKKKLGGVAYPALRQGGEKKNAAERKNVWTLAGRKP